MKRQSVLSDKQTRQGDILYGPVLPVMMRLALPTTIVLIAQTLVNVA